MYVWMRYVEHFTSEMPHLLLELMCININPSTFIHSFVLRSLRVKIKFSAAIFFLLSFPFYPFNFSLFCFFFGFFYVLTFLHAVFLYPFFIIDFNFVSRSCSNVWMKASKATTIEWETVLFFFLSLSSSSSYSERSRLYRSESFIHNSHELIINWSCTAWIVKL